MKSMIAIAIVAAAGTTAAQELTINGDFETGDLTGWTAGLPAGATANVTGDSNSGAFAGTVFNNTAPSAALLRQEFIGQGVVQPGDEITITFSAKGDFVAGGVFIAEFFSEQAGGGTSASEILGGQPIFFDSTSEYQTFSFTTFAGPDVTNGVTLQLVAATGGAAGSTAVLFVDDVSVFRVPSPASAALLGLGGLAATRRRR